MTREQLARDIIEAGIDLLACADHEGNDPQTLTAGDLVFVSNMIRDHVLAAVKWKNEKIATLESSLDAALEGRAELIGSEKTLRDKLETRSMLLEAAQAGNRLLADGLLELKAKLADVVLVIQGEIDPADLDTLATRRETARRRREDPHYCPHGKTLPSCHYCAMESDPPCPRRRKIQAPRMRISQAAHNSLRVDARTEFYSPMVVTLATWPEISRLMPPARIGISIDDRTRPDESGTRRSPPGEPRSPQKVIRERRADRTPQTDDRGNRIEDPDRDHDSPRP